LSGRALGGRHRRLRQAHRTLELAASSVISASGSRPIYRASLPSIASSQLGRACSLPVKAAKPGRSISTLPPWKPSLPFVLPTAMRLPALARAWRGPQASRRHPPPSFRREPRSGGQAKSLEARRHARQRLDLQLSHRNRGGCDKSVHWRCFPLVESTPQSLQASRRGTPLHLFQQ